MFYGHAEQFRRLVESRVGRHTAQDLGVLVTSLEQSTVLYTKTRISNGATAEVGDRTLFHAFALIRIPKGSAIATYSVNRHS